MEILSFLPDSVLNGIDIDTLGKDEFFEYLAKARYLEEIRQAIQTNAIVDAFRNDDE